MKQPKPRKKYNINYTIEVGDLYLEKRYDYVNQVMQSIDESRISKIIDFDADWSEFDAQGNAVINRVVLLDVYEKRATKHCCGFGAFRDKYRKLTEQELNELAIKDIIE